MSATETPALRLYGDTGTTPPPDLHPNGVNHLAISTADMKAQLTFFAEVLGCPTRALYWMHGVANTFHGFVELSGDSYVAFVQAPGNPTEPQWGVTHSGNPGGAVTAGTMQHVAFNVDSIDDLLTMRDRIRSHGIQVLGPLDHGMIQSIYFAGPEGLSLEVCCGRDIDERQWVDPEVQALCGISDQELARLTDPPGFTRPAQPVAQPAHDETKPNQHYPASVRDKIMGMPDADVWTNLSESTPPVPLDEDTTGFDPDAMPRVAAGDPSLPGTLELGVFSLSLSVADLDASRDFYEKLGFVVAGGDADSGWLILKNGETTLGLFHAMFPRNMLTFNPGLTPRMERIESFTDVRELRDRLRAAGLEVDSEIEDGSAGAGSITLVDPDGNPILIDQFF